MICPDTAPQATSLLSWLTLFFGGFVGAASVLGLERVLDSRKDKLRDKNIFEAFKEEIVSNLEMLSANCVELEEELKIVDSNQHLLTALTPFYFSTWDILKTHVPAELTNKEVFRQLSLTMHLTLLINNEIESREQFKLNGAALSNFSQTLKKRDQLLLMRHEKLLTEILKLKKDLGLNVDFSSPSTSLKQVVKDVKKSKSKS
jgi:hypothetical protein